MLKFLRKLLNGRPMDASVTQLTALSAGNNHQKAEARAWESEERFATLVSGVRDYAIFLLDRRGNVVTWNAGAERIKGYRADEIIGQHFSRFYPHDALASAWPAHELEVAAETGRFEDEGWRLRKDGSKFWASVVLTALRDSAGDVRGYLKITRDLTDRKQAEEKLRISEERFRVLIEGVKDCAIFMLDPQGRIVTWNSGAEQLNGYRPEEIVGQHFSIFYPQEVIDGGSLAEVTKKAAENGRWEDTAWRVRKDGSKFWANSVVTALRDETGGLRGFVNLTRDLSERREAEENARRFVEEEARRKAAEEANVLIEREREQLHVTLSSIGDAIVVTDQQGAITFLNPVAADLTGWSLREATGQPLEKVFVIINELTRKPVDNPVTQVFREQRVIELANHTALISKDGQVIPIEDTAAPIRMKDGAIVGAVLVFRDVTESRRARDATERLAAIVESSDDAIIGKTIDGVITSWNRGAERLYGYTADEMVGKPLSLLAPPDHPDELPMLMERIKLGEYIEHFETKRRRKDGALLDVSLTISPIRDAHGEIIGASKIARDITSRKAEERRRNEFLALLAHELRNPLAPLRNGLQIIGLAPGNQQTVEQMRTLMERQLEHLVRLVDDLLDVSRINQGKLELRKERMLLADALNHSLDVCGRTIRDQGHELSVTISDEPMHVDADRTRLAQVVCNLLNNATKYSPSGSRIWLTSERQNNHAVISIKDEGIGIRADMLPKIFEMFMQADQSLEKSQGGLGLGLTVVKKLIEMHGGDIEARSEGQGKGSEFVVRLPLVEPAPQSARQDEAPHQSRPQISRRILVVDDNADAAASLALMLKLMKNEVHTAADGEAAVEAASQFQPDVILMDIGMPKLNGYDAARRIRDLPRGSQVMLVALTGWGKGEDRQRSLDAGFNFHLVKPIEPNELKRLLTELPAN